jgi:hypothetical protein
LLQASLSPSHCYWARNKRAAASKAIAVRRSGKLVFLKNETDQAVRLITRTVRPSFKLKAFFSKCVNTGAEEKTNEILFSGALNLS